jgi:hypothetical protein
MAKGAVMRNRVEIEDIEGMRRQRGIDDAELRVEIGGLEVGDLVNLTLLTGTSSFETLSVRITSIRGSTFRGKLAARPASTVLAHLRVGTLLTFTTAHIHSLPKGQEAQEE